MKLTELFRLMVEKEGSDLYLRTMAIPCARINGKVEHIISDP
ncbi:hypothetical protein MNBD_BACTEROID05-809, partial [hydrothermal vent metagenome]